MGQVVVSFIVPGVGLNVRAEPSTKAALIQVLGQNTEVHAKKGFIEQGIGINASYPSPTKEAPSADGKYTESWIFITYPVRGWVVLSRDGVWSLTTDKPGMSSLVSDVSSKKKKKVLPKTPPAVVQPGEPLPAAPSDKVAGGNSILPVAVPGLLLALLWWKR